MAKFSRMLGAVVLLGGLAGCGSSPAPDEPALAAATGIPAGAPGAVGVKFDGPSPASTELPDPHPMPLPKHLPPDPFDPLDDGDGDHAPDAGVAPPPPLPPHKPPKKKGMQL
ncbi:MAG: hypothetical protein U0359_23995 [Byssovorax sp.]